MSGILDNIVFNVIPIIVVLFVMLMTIKLFSIIIMKIFKDANKAKVDKITKVIMSCAVLIGIAVIALSVAFLSNPFERKNAKTITSAVVDESYVAPSTNEIATSNKESVTTKDKENKESAATDNTKAMEDALKLFDDVEKSVNQK